MQAKDFKSVSIKYGVARSTLGGWLSDDEFNQSSILRVDVRSDYEVESKLVSVLTLAGSEAAELVGGKNVITKIPVYAVERINAAENAGFKKSDSCLIGKNGYTYDNYWVLSQ